MDHHVVDVGKQLVAVQGTSRGFWGVTQATGGAGRVILKRSVEDLYLAVVELLAGIDQAMAEAAVLEVGDSGIVHSKLDVLVSQPPERSHDDSSTGVCS